MALLLVSLSFGVAVKADIKYKGDVNIGVLVDLHEDGGLEDGQDRVCGKINMEAVQQVIAAKWAIEVINNQSLPHELNIGLEIQDTCSNRLIGQDQIFKIISSVQKGDKGHLIGLIGVGSPEYLVTAGAALNAFHVPVVAVDPDIYTKSEDRILSNILTTAPDLAGQARALANIGLETGTRRIALISSSQQTMASFLAEATTLGIRVPEILELVPRQINIGPAVEGFLRSIARPRPVVAVVLDPADVVAVAEHLKHVDLPSDPTWLLGSLGLELHRQKSWLSVFQNGVFAEPHMPELREFKEYFLSSLKNPDEKLSGFIAEYMEQEMNCKSSNDISNNILHVPGTELLFSGQSRSRIPCSRLSLADMELNFQQDPKVSFVVKAVSALTAAFRLVQLDACGQDIEVNCIRTVRQGLHQDILENLHKLSFTSMSGIQEVEGTRHHFTASGRLVANKQILYSIREADGIVPIGWYSEDDGLNIKENVLETSLDATTPAQEESTAPRSSPLVTHRDAKQSRETYSRSISDGDDKERELKAVEVKPPIPLPSTEQFIARGWALGVVSVALVGILCSLWMLVYVNIKLCDNTLSGNQSMGLVLLLGNMLVFGSCLPWILPPTQTICALRHFLHPLALCLCFGLLLIKVMQLRSLVSVGLGGKIPQINQLLSLFFMVMVQVVITCEWYVINLPLEVAATDGYPHCAVAKETFLLLHVYPCLLLLLTLLYGLSVFNIKRNYNEGRWVLCTTLILIPIFLVWALIFYFGGPDFQDASTAISLVIIGTVMLVTVFLPKMHTISQQSKFRKLKINTTSESTMYNTAYAEYPPPPTAGGMYYPMPGTPAAGAYPPPRYTRSQSKYKNRVNINNMNPYGYRFNGLNYLAPVNTTSYMDWNREHSPGIYHTNTVSYKRHATNGHHKPSHHSHSRSNKSKTPESATLAKPLKRCSRTPDSKLSSRSRSKQGETAAARSSNPPPHPPSYYDKNARVYHITP